MNKIIFYRGCIISPKKEGGFLIETPTKKQIWVKDATILDDCKNWIDKQLARLTIYKTIG